MLHQNTMWHSFLLCLYLKGQGHTYRSNVVAVSTVWVVTYCICFVWLYLSDCQESMPLRSNQYALSSWVKRKCMTQTQSLHTHALSTRLRDVACVLQLHIRELLCQLQVHCCFYYQVFLILDNAVDLTCPQYFWPLSMTVPFKIQTWK